MTAARAMPLPPPPLFPGTSPGDTGALSVAVADFAKKTGLLPAGTTLPNTTTATPGNAGAGAGTSAGTNAGTTAGKTAAAMTGTTSGTSAGSTTAAMAGNTTGVKNGGSPQTNVSLPSNGNSVAPQNGAPLPSASQNPDIGSAKLGPVDLLQRLSLVRAQFFPSASPPQSLVPPLTGAGTQSTGSRTLPTQAMSPMGAPSPADSAAADTFQKFQQLLGAVLTPLVPEAAPVVGAMTGGQSGKAGSAVAGPGGKAAGPGGSSAGPGGLAAESGGAAAKSGGATAGPGGSAAGPGGSAAGPGGSAASPDGSVAMSEGPGARSGGAAAGPSGAAVGPSDAAAVPGDAAAVPGGGLCTRNPDLHI